MPSVGLLNPKPSLANPTMKILMTGCIFLFFTYFNSSIYQDNNFELITLIKVNAFYVYTPNIQLIKIDNSFYFPQMEAHYQNGQLKSIMLFKSEGKIGYSIKDLKHDKQLLEFMDVPLKAKLSIFKNHLVFNDSKIPIKSQREDSLFTILNKRITLFIIKNPQNKSFTPSR